MSAITALYSPPTPGLPYLLVVTFTSGEVVVTPFELKKDAEVFLVICNVGLLEEAKEVAYVN